MSNGTKDQYTARTLKTLKALLSDYHRREFNVRLWNGHQWPAETNNPKFTLQLNSPGALSKMFAGGGSDLSLGEAYIYGYFDIEGDLESVFAVGNHLLDHPPALGKKLRLALQLYRLPKGRKEEMASPNINKTDSGQQNTSKISEAPNRTPARLSGAQRSLSRDKQAVTYHYNVSNDFYKLWLDKRMVYSCGYFKNQNDDLDTAQLNKLDHLCHKLRLKKGEKLLDIGCGWGGLIIRAAQHYGADATGVTLSQPQADLANQRIAETNLSDHCRAQVRDYRTLINDNVQFDKIVSVGMVEHVGLSQLPTYFSTAYKLLKPGGLFVNHGITRSAWVKIPKGPNFIHSYVFPDGELMPISVRMNYAERAGFEVRDTEDLREHYAMTLRNWVQRLHEKKEQALKYVSEMTYRVWELYMSGSAYNFACGGLNLYQTVLSKMDETGNAHLPLTREDLYS